MTTAEMATKERSKMFDTSWIDREEYPFRSRNLELEMGNMHYVDEGAGEPIVMCHGNPTWSFLYRHLVKGLSPKYRCVAMDHIGFGLSHKPSGWAYLPEDHAKNLEVLIERLELKEVTLVVQDWGGPIGLSYAVRNPENVKRLVIMNTWMWSVKGLRDYEFFSGLMDGPIGRFMIRHWAIFSGPFVRFISGDQYRSKFDPTTRRHYLKTLENPDDRQGFRVFPGQIIGSSEWLDRLWSQREKIQDIPALLMWGMKDPSFKERELGRFERLFKSHKTFRFANVGHYVQEETKGELVPIIDEFMLAGA